MLKTQLTNKIKMTKIPFKINVVLKSPQKGELNNESEAHPFAHAKFQYVKKSQLYKQRTKKMGVKELINSYMAWYVLHFCSVDKIAQMTGGAHLFLSFMKHCSHKEKYLNKINNSKTDPPKHLPGCPRRIKRYHVPLHFAGMLR